METLYLCLAIMAGRKLKTPKITPKLPVECRSKQCQDVRNLIQSILSSMKRNSRFLVTWPGTEEYSDGLFGLWTDGSHQLFSVRFDNSLAICVSPTCSNQGHQLVHQTPCHVLSCLHDIACKRSPAIFRKTRTPCPVSRLLYFPTWPVFA